MWTGQGDQLTPRDLLAYQQALDRSRVYYDLPPVPEDTEGPGT